MPNAYVTMYHPCKQIRLSNSVLIFCIYRRCVLPPPPHKVWQTHPPTYSPTPHPPTPHSPAHPHNAHLCTHPHAHIHAIPTHTSHSCPHHSLARLPTRQPHCTRPPTHTTHQYTPTNHPTNTPTSLTRAPSHSTYPHIMNTPLKAIPQQHIPTICLLSCSNSKRHMGAFDFRSALRCATSIQRHLITQTRGGGLKPGKGAHPPQQIYLHPTLSNSRKFSLVFTGKCAQAGVCWRPNG